MRRSAALLALVLAAPASAQAVTFTNPTPFTTPTPPGGWGPGISRIETRDLRGDITDVNVTLRD